MRRQFLYFGIVGALGFVVDAGVLTLALRVIGLGFYSGRLLSYLCAATVTWALNRRYTFKADVSRRHWFQQWLAFLAVNAAGGALNYGVYSLLVANVPVVTANPVLGVAAGSISGLAANFFLSRRFVFGGKSSAIQ